MVYTSAKVRNAIISTERSDSFWAEQLGKALDPPSSYEQLLEASPDGTPPSLSVSKSYLFECYDKHRKRPKADVYVCGLGWVSFCVSEPADVVLRVRTLPGVIHGVREPLRYNDLRAFKFWPKLKRRSTSKGLLDDEHGQDTESINTVVRLTTANTQAAGEEVDLHGMAVRPVTKVAHPRHETASDAPLEGLLSDLHSSGKL
ncbi:hypothetical protein AGDE_13337 [Angomonas deanei]|nr:hypothetical protein AGDE_13337 [Angomonas deanei]|eukprot:EPY22445.1 hypothetical protein AGDE_13337 [Angomonas deanei]